MMAANKNFLITYKLFFALLGFSSIITEIAVLNDRGKFNPANFFSYFTIEANIIVVAVLMASALFVRQGKSGSWMTFLRGASTFFITTVLVVFVFLLANIKNAEFTAVPWDNTVLHYIIPIVVLVDWLIDPPKVRIPYRRAFLWLLLPITYVTYSLIRGAITGWYPYPFLDPSADGYAHVAVSIAPLLAFGAAMVWLLLRVPKISVKPN
jgi:hypothetical protein